MNNSCEVFRSIQERKNTQSPAIVIGMEANSHDLIGGQPHSDAVSIWICCSINGLYLDNNRWSGRLS